MAHFLSVSNGVSWPPVKLGAAGSDAASPESKQQLWLFLSHYHRPCVWWTLRAKIVLESLLIKVARPPLDDSLNARSAIMEGFVHAPTALMMTETSVWLRLRTQWTVNTTYLCTERESFCMSWDICLKTVETQCGQLLKRKKKMCSLVEYISLFIRRPQ